MLAGLWLAALASPAAGAASDDLVLKRLAGPRADVAALLLGGMESGSLRTAALAAARCVAAPEPAGTSPVDLWVEVDGASLLDAVEQAGDGALPPSARLELYAYAVNADREITANLSEWVRAPLRELTGPRPAAGVKLRTRLALAPGEHQIRILVRETSSQRFALRVAGVRVPEPGEGAPRLSLLRFDDSRAAWIRAASSSLPEVSLGGGESEPAALPLVGPGQDSAVGFLGCGLQQAGLRARLLDRERRPVAAEARIEELAATGTGGRVGRLRLSGASPGFHLLEVEASVPGEPATTSTLPVFVVASPWGESLNAWTGLDGGAAVIERSVAESGGAGDGNLGELGEESGAVRADAVADAYRAVLARLARGRREEAVSALQALEEGVLEADDRQQRALKRLAAGEDQVARELFARDPECLLPLLVLHLELQRRYQDSAGDPHLLFATRSRIRSLAQVYATRAKSEMAPALAARSLVEMANGLERSGYLISALVVLREAILLDRENPQALLDLAFQYEVNGMGDEALELLQRLLEIDPDSDEGRLRRAVILLRLEQSQAAVETLEALLATGREEWVLAVAYQELARIRVEQGRDEDAADLLEAAVRRLPSVQRLHIVFAWALDRSGRRAEAGRVVARMPAAAAGPSPRLRYRVRSEPRGEGARQALLRHATARLPQLASALATRGSGR